jgi:hypothetical protein
MLRRYRLAFALLLLLCVAVTTGIPMCLRRRNLAMFNSAKAQAAPSTFSGAASAAAAHSTHLKLFKRSLQTDCNFLPQEEHDKSNANYMRKFAKCLLLIHQKDHEHKHVQPHAPDIKLELAEKKGWSSIKANAVDAVGNVAHDKVHARDHMNERAHAEDEDSSSYENQWEKGLKWWMD